MLTRDAFPIYRAYLWNVFLCIPDTTPLLHNVESGEGGGAIIIIITGQVEGGSGEGDEGKICNNLLEQIEVK